ncbi:hypothetical protein pipiens_014196 [Culex pipiens pipiens]|uniref:Uncharacterized protein n=1 Tax=Culex pipiens pipiens TaxID=38569 RepID=A0ABD1CVS6_CULPP
MTLPAQGWHQVTEWVTNCVVKSERSSGIDCQEEDVPCVRSPGRLADQSKEEEQRNGGSHATSGRTNRTDLTVRHRPRQKQAYEPGETTADQLSCGISLRKFATTSFNRVDSGDFLPVRG